MNLRERHISEHAKDLIIKNQESFWERWVVYAEDSGNNTTSEEKTEINKEEKEKQELADEEIPEDDINNYQSKATKEIINIFHKNGGAWRNLNLSHTGTIKTIIDEKTKKSAGILTKIATEAKKKVGYYGNQALKSFKRLSLRLHEAEKVKNDLSNSLATIRERRIKIKKANDAIPLWRPWLKAKALKQKYITPVGDFVGSKFIKFGESHRESIVEKALNITKNIITADEKKLDKDKEKMDNRVESDNEKKDIILKSIGWENNQGNKDIINKYIQEKHTDNEVKKFSDKIDNINDPNERKTIKIFLDSMKSSWLGEVNSAKIEETNEDINKIKREQEIKKRILDTRLKLNNQWEKAIKGYNLKTGGTISLSVDQNRESLNGQWTINSISNNNKTITINKKNNGQGISLTIDKNEKGYWDVTTNGNENIIADITKIEFNALKT